MWFIFFLEISSQVQNKTTQNEISIIYIYLFDKIMLKLIMIVSHIPITNSV